VLSCSGRSAFASTKRRGGEEERDERRGDEERRGEERRGEERRGGEDGGHSVEPTRGKQDVTRRGFRRVKPTPPDIALLIKAIHTLQSSTLCVRAD